MGCRQVVRHQVLVLAFGGSNPSIPAILEIKQRNVDLCVGVFYFV